jgi:hypothetical protein
MTVCRSYGLLERATAVTDWQTKHVQLCTSGSAHPYHFEVTENGRGYWIAKDKEGLVGGVFRTQKDALRFALFEAAGDSACVQVNSSSKPLSTAPDSVPSH